MSIPRNDPCPCGSGRKYKKCCGAPVIADITTADPQVVLANAVKRADLDLHETLTRYMSKRLGQKWLRSALDLFMEECEPGMEQAELELAVPWVVYHCPVNDFGDSVASLRMREPRPRLPDSQLAVLLAQLVTRLSIWQVTAVEPGVGIALTDMLTGASAFVHEVKASHTVTVHLAILARVVTVKDVSFIAGVHPQPLTPRFADRAVAVMRKYFRVRTRPVKAEKLMHPDAVLDLLLVWRSVIDAQMTPPEMSNTDGDPLVLITDRFDFPSSRQAAVISALEALPGAGPALRDDEGIEVVISKPSTDSRSGGRNVPLPLEQTMIARIEVEKTRLLVETNSVARADAAKALITTALGSLVRFRIREEADVQELIRDAREARESGQLPPPPESTPEMDAMMRQFREDYMQRWLDDSIPALGGLTPREAAADPKHHAPLQALLRDVEYHESQLPAAQQCDMGRLRKQLGM